MTTNIDIDEKKLAELMKLKSFKSKKEAVNAAIDEYLKKMLRLEALSWKGKGWDGDLDQMRLD